MKSLWGILLVVAATVADLLLIDGNPLADIRHTVRIDSVWKNGAP